MDEIKKIKEFIDGNLSRALINLQGEELCFIKEPTRNPNVIRLYVSKNGSVIWIGMASKVTPTRSALKGKRILLLKSHYESVLKALNNEESDIAHFYEDAIRDYILQYVVNETANKIWSQNENGLDEDELRPFGLTQEKILKETDDLWLDNLLNQRAHLEKSTSASLLKHSIQNGNIFRDVDGFFVTEEEYALFFFGTNEDCEHVKTQIAYRLISMPEIPSKAFRKICFAKFLSERYASLPDNPIMLDLKAAIAPYVPPPSSTSNPHVYISYSGETGENEYTAILPLRDFERSWFAKTGFLLSPVAMSGSEVIPWDRIRWVKCGKKTVFKKEVSGSAV